MCQVIAAAIPMGLSKVWCQDPAGGEETQVEIVQCLRANCYMTMKSIQGYITRPIGPYIIAANYYLNP